MKKLLINFLSKIPCINRYFSGIATIFMLHRVAPFEKDRLLPNENMKVPPDFLEKFILELKNEGYEFISLDELYDILKNQKKVNKKIIFTLDDGYKDNYEIAYPIFKKHNVPFTIYLTTSFPDKNALLWWYVLEDLIIKNDELIVGNIRYVCKTYEDKNKVFLEIRNKILKLDQKNLLKELNTLFKNYKIDWFSKNNQLCMSWEDVINLSKDSLCTIGNHTKNHYVFNKLSEDEIIDEVEGANKKIEEKIGKKVEHFAFPYGGKDEVGLREFQIIKRFNFKTVTTTRRGNIYLEHKNFLNCCLPRIMLVDKFRISDIGRIRKQRVVTV
ncbi:MAG TPA: polysaccharide deacetylase family protein [Hydrogenothermaceae bacterium]|nr:polysaccharide deacetylase family protein [Hydrogenothermaceae bacterium]